MKKIFNIALSAILGLSLSGCNDFLTLVPLNDVVLENFWTDKSDVESVLLGVYASLESQDCITRMSMWGEMRSDNIVASSTASNDLTQILKDNILETNSMTSWSCFYDVINRANTVIEYAPGVAAKDPNYTDADLREYGVVQRALLGIQGTDVTDMRQLEENKGKDFGTLDGAYVVEVVDEGGAIAAGLQSGDIITAVDGRRVKSMTELMEILAQYRPGDKVKVTFIRDKKEKSTTVTLKNSRGNTDIVKNVDVEVLGAAFQEVPDQLKRQLNIGYGVQVSGLNSGKLRDAGIQKGFIILKINGVQIKSESDVEEAYNSAASSPEQVMFITGIYSSGRRANYAVDLSE